MSADAKAKRVHAVLHLGVSTSSRSQYGDVLAYDQNPAVQEEPLRRLAQQRGWTITHVCCDRISGAKEKRPALDELMADARHKKFDVVMVWRFDRLSRGVLYSLPVVAEVQQLGIDLAQPPQLEE